MADIGKNAGFLGSVLWNAFKTGVAEGMARAGEAIKNAPAAAKGAIDKAIDSDPELQRLEKLGEQSGRQPGSGSASDDALANVRDRFKQAPKAPATTPPAPVEPAPARTPATTNLEDQLARLKAQLGGSAPATPAVPAPKDGAKTILETLKGKIAAKEMDEASAAQLIELAIGGDDEAQTLIVTCARECPQAFTAAHSSRLRHGSAKSIPAFTLAVMLLEKSNPSAVASRRTM